MPDFDVAMKMLFESDQAVADVFNMCIGKGRGLIDASMVRPATEREIALRRHSDRRLHARERTKDIVRCIQWNPNDPDDYLLLGLENQLHPHYLMPWRVHESYILFFGRQLRKIKRDYANSQGGKTPAEFLSGFPRGTLFPRTLTIVIYWGTEEWDAPVNYAEMVRPPPFKEVRRYEPKWTYPLLIPAKIPLKMLAVKEKILEIALKYAWAVQSKRRLQALLEGKPEIRNVPRVLAKGLLEITGTMCEINEDQETVNMCNAMQEWGKEKVKEGRKEGRKEEREQNARNFAAYLQAQSLPVRKIRSTLRKWFRLATRDLDKICPLL